MFSLSRALSRRPVTPRVFFVNRLGCCCRCWLPRVSLLGRCVRNVTSAEGTPHLQRPSASSKYCCCCCWCRSLRPPAAAAVGFPYRIVAAYRRCRRRRRLSMRKSRTVRRCADSVARKFIIFCVVHKLPQSQSSPNRSVYVAYSFGSSEVSVTAAASSSEKYLLFSVGKFGVLEVAIASPVQCSAEQCKVRVRSEWI